MDFLLLIYKCLFQVLDIQDDIQTTMSQSVAGDDGELEEELAKLLEEDQDVGKPGGPEGDLDVKQLEDQLKNLHLPTTPKEKPSFSESLVSL